MSAIYKRLPTKYSSYQSLLDKLFVGYATKSTNLRLSDFAFDLCQLNEDFADIDKD